MAWCVPADQAAEGVVEVVATDSAEPVARREAHILEAHQPMKQKALSTAPCITGNSSSVPQPTPEHRLPSHNVDKPVSS